MKKLSVIVPFRCENKNSSFLLERLNELCSIFPQNEEIEFLVVDSGSALEFSQKCKDICEKYKVRYLFENTRGKTFSLSHCRDIGVISAQGKAITFLDVDLRFAPSFWDRLLLLMDAWGISFYKKSFLAVPCVYLSPEGTELFHSLPNDELKYQKFYLEYLQGINDNVESFAACSSVMIVDRLHYLSIGGHNSEFSGHGYEDFELYNRLLGEESIISEADNYLHDAKNWNTSTYNGFRSQFSIIARPALMMNIMVYHLWHPRPKEASFYDPKKLAENRKKIFHSFEKFKQDGIHPVPLKSHDSEYKKIIYFGVVNDNAYNVLRDIFPLLGDVICLSEYDLVDSSTFEVHSGIYDLIESHGVELFLFPNPYGNKCRLALYKWCRENNFPYLCFERGALPDSWFFDSNGCNADSISYKSVDYLKSLSQKEIDQTEKYIYECLNILQPLEQQGNRIGGAALLEKFKIQGKKVLFVPLQRPSDTVIKYYLGELGSFDEFIEKIDILAGQLKKLGWFVLAKKHPLETIQPGFENITYVPEDTNFLDLLEACDAVALINSGVGVYSMMMNKPCYTFGKAFYSVEGVNYSVSNNEYETEDAINQLALKINKGFEFDYSNMLKFINFLAFKFYSFGVPKVVQRVEKDQSLRTITIGIDFYKILLNKKILREYSREHKRALSRNTPLYERYALDIFNKNKKKTELVKVEAKFKAVTAPKKVEVKPTTVTKDSLPKSEIVNTSKVELNRVENNQNIVNVVGNIALPNQRDKARRKWHKLKYKPHYFFADSKIVILRPLKKLFKE